MAADQAWRTFIFNDTGGNHQRMAQNVKAENNIAYLHVMKLKQAVIKAARCCLYNAAV